MAKEYGSLSLEQQGKLMREIDELVSEEGDDNAKDHAKELIDFVYALCAHSFIAPNNRVKYLEGIQDAMERRLERQGAKV